MESEERLYQFLVETKYTEEELETYKESKNKAFFLSFLETPFDGKLQTINTVSLSEILTEKEKDVIFKKYFREVNLINKIAKKF